MDPVAEYMQTDQKNKKDKFVYLNRLAKKGQILFAGSSLMEQFPVNESDKLPEGEWAAHLRASGQLISLIPATMKISAGRMRLSKSWRRRWDAVSWM